MPAEIWDKAGKDAKLQLEHIKSHKCGFIKAAIALHLFL